MLERKIYETATEFRILNSYNIYTMKEPNNNKDLLWLVAKKKKKKKKKKVFPSLQKCHNCEILHL